VERVLAASASPPASLNGVKTLSPEGAIKSTGAWDVGSRAGDFVFVAGMRGVDPKTNTLVQGDEARIRQAFLNMKLIAEFGRRRPARLRAPRCLRHRHVSVPPARE
jgi:2-iminobutanoate/2-iminopropanoate deaminase